MSLMEPVDEGHDFSAGVCNITYIAKVEDDSKQFAWYEGKRKIGMTSYKAPRDKSIADLLGNDFTIDENGLYVGDSVNKLAERRIHDWSGTAHLPAKLEYAALNVRETDNGYETYDDHDVHRVLARSGYKRDKEWFAISHEDAMSSLIATARGDKNIVPSKFNDRTIVLRPEQKQFVNTTMKSMLANADSSEEIDRRYLWNAIMRFGKTVTVYDLLRELIVKKKKFSKVLILTHRPVVANNWFEDFLVMFKDNEEVQFASKAFGNDWEDLDKDKPFVYFASIQDTRGSGFDGEYSKNEELFDTEFDLLVVDEGHEGTKTNLAEVMFDQISAKFELVLSGTPFNITDGFKPENVLNWTYIDERLAYEGYEKAIRDFEALDEVARRNLDRPVNPLASLPSIELRTIDVESVVISDGETTPSSLTVSGSSFAPDNDSAGKCGGFSAGFGESRVFSLGKFFAVDTSVVKKGAFGEYYPFKHEANVAKLLEHIFKSDDFLHDNVESAMFPFATKGLREYFAHTFWVLPSVAACDSLREMLNVIRPEYFVVNATADSNKGDDLSAVREAISKHDRTITLSVGKLTTGTTVPEWAAVFMLNGMTSPMKYMQTAFRCKSPGSVNGRIKDNVYIFDFDPNRALNVVARVADSAARSRMTDTSSLQDLAVATNEEVDRWVKFFPIISSDGAKFKVLDSFAVFSALKKVYIEETYNTGFQSPRLFDVKFVDAPAAEVLEDLKLTFAKSTSEKVKSFVISETSKVVANDVSPVGHDKGVEPKLDVNVDNEASEQEKRERRVIQNARELLRILATRIPLLVFATRPDARITPETFPELIDDASWEEFMNGLSKDGWRKITYMFDPVVFEGSCNLVRENALAADERPLLEGLLHRVNMFSIFKNPDKETVLTPWPVVNSQLAETVGGYRWVNDDGLWYASDGSVQVFDNIDNDEKLSFAPVFYPSPDGVDVWNEGKTFFDINSKTSLYMVYACLSLWLEWAMREEEENGVFSDDVGRRKMEEIVSKQIFINVKVPYSRSIAQRVLLGYKSDVTVNATVCDIVAVRNHIKNVKKNVKANELSLLVAWLLQRDDEDTTVGEFGTFSERYALLLGEKSDIEKALIIADDKDRIVKYDFLLSNPPYQIANDNGAVSIYHLFMLAAKEAAENVSMIYPSRWLVGGSGEGIDEFRNIELASKHYSKFVVVSDGSKLFKGVDIAGGVNYFLWNKEISKHLDYFYDGRLEQRSSLSNGFKSMVINPNYSLILKRLNVRYSLYISGSNIYGDIVKSSSSVSRAISSFKQKKDEYINYCNLHYVNNKKNLTSTVFPSSLLREKTDKYKTVISVTAHPIDKKLSRLDRIFLLKPGDSFSGSFIGRMFETKEESENCLYYLKTDFVNFLIGVLTITQHATRKVYAFVPDVNFATGEIVDKPGVKLDFSKPETLDDQLAEIYGLTDEDRELITSSIRPWRDKTSLTADRGK